MRGFLRSLAAQGRAVLVSSHLMGELQDTADHVVVVGRGQVIADASVAELIANASGGHVSVRTTMPGRAVEVLSGAEAKVAATSPGTLIIAGLAAEQVVMLLSRHAVPFSEVSAHRATLEEAYMELTREAVEFRAAASEGSA
jgi:ABC-2 type transport system ATP-binding protein